VRFDAAAGRHGYWAYGFAALGQEHQSCASVVRVGSSLDVAELLELVDDLRHRLFAYVRELRELAHWDAARAHEGEDIRVRGVDVAEAGFGEDQPGQPPMVRSIQGQVYRFDFIRLDGGWSISRIETIPVWKSGHLDRSPTPR
jgi:hypothetical protein